VVSGNTELIPSGYDRADSQPAIGERPAPYAGRLMPGALCRAPYAGRLMPGALCRAADAGRLMPGG